MIEKPPDTLIKPHQAMMTTVAWKIERKSKMETVSTPTTAPMPKIISLISLLSVMLLMTVMMLFAVDDAYADEGNDTSTVGQRIAVTVVWDTSPNTAGIWDDMMALAKQAVTALKPGDRLEVVSAHHGDGRLRVSQEIKAADAQEVSTIVDLLKNIQRGKFFATDVAAALELAFQRLDRLDARHGAMRVVVVVLTDGDIANDQVDQILKLATVFRARGWSFHFIGKDDTARRLLVAASQGELAWSLVSKADPAKWLDEIRKAAEQSSKDGTPKTVPPTDHERNASTSKPSPADDNTNKESGSFKSSSTKPSASVVPPVLPIAGDAHLPSLPPPSNSPCPTSAPTDGATMGGAAGAPPATRPASSPACPTTNSAGMGGRRQEAGAIVADNEQTPTSTAPTQSEDRTFAAPGGMAAAATTTQPAYHSETQPGLLTQSAGGTAVEPSVPAPQTEAEAFPELGLEPREIHNQQHGPQVPSGTKGPHAGQSPATRATAPNGTWWTSFFNNLWDHWLARLIVNIAGIAVAAVMAIAVFRGLTASRQWRVKVAASLRKVPRQAKLPEVLLAATNGQTFRLGAINTLRAIHVGARQDNVIRLSDPAVAPRHLRLFVSRRGLMLKNLATTPVIVNGSKLRPRRKMPLILPAAVKLGEKATLNLRLARHGAPEE